MLGNFNAELLILFEKRLKVKKDPILHIDKVPLFCKGIHILFCQRHVEICLLLLFFRHAHLPLCFHS